MKEWEMISAIESMDAHHFTLFSGGLSTSLKDICEGCGQVWPCRTERIKRAVVAEFRRLKQLETDHV